MRLTFVFTCLVGGLVNLVGISNTEAAFTLTDKNNANPMTFPTGATATSTYIMETQYSQPFQPSTPGSTAGFRFNDTDSTPATLLTTPNPGADLRQGTSQNLAGNSNNGYVGTVVGKPWGNAVTMTLGNGMLVNGPGADLYITSKNVTSGVVQTTSTTNKSIDVGFHVVNQGSLNGWHLYNVAALPSNYQPSQGANSLGAIDLSNLKFGSGLFTTADLTSLTTTMPAGILIDQIILVNNNSANDWAFGFLGNTSEAPTGFVARRDFDNADADGDGFTGVDYLTSRYGDRDTNGQDGPQAWFVGLNNTVVATPEPSALLVGLLEFAVVGLIVIGRRFIGFGASAPS